MVGRRVAYLTLFKAFVDCFEQANEVVLSDSMEGEEMELKHMIEDAEYIEKTLQGLCYYSSAHSMRQIVRYLESQLPKQESESRKILRALLGHRK